ncbi:GM21104 [Drosophila sechellia]|uniref:GM21104 n=1 Tax=Drosophila sechellia TaxID=7238 RepID=B4HSN4_DROSE|nr:GM21104 [Drosophila sechellia]
MPRDDEEPILALMMSAGHRSAVAATSNRTFASWLKRPRSLILEPAVFLVFFGKIP